ncbi:DUF262 domain-containing protein [Micromonospora polyrhachis]|uniref:DUF262 domain-containing protein n=1 Tax=Micromonospora polyrhachis TaxID=1282883 RepID=A0A7W7WP50_9ACTN|nr:DUF262 domain-containing protein [Micromonospora polyrhachis]MBB4957888.1 hypothetical protein [Micromonospora polyrhachis]
MQAQTLTPAKIFGLDVRHVIPLFQRPYVWTEEDQWAPLWDDISRVAEQLLETPVGYGTPKVVPHFLGAIVLEQPLVQSGYILVRNVIDGQQRLTTLQLLLDAAQWVTEQRGTTMDAQALRVLVCNKPEIAAQPYEVFKVWPTDRDQEAFQAAMDNALTVPPALADAAVARAHAFFVTVIEDWAEVTGDPAKAAARLTALTQTLRDHLKIVVIDLEPGDNAQVIFETLNHRGVPLLAADLIKNFVFQIAEAQKLDVTDLYRRQWRKLDTDYWRQKLSRGRQYVPRIDIFVNYWLIERLRTEVPADRIFVAFRDHLMDEQPDIEKLLAELSRDADNYASLDTWPADSAVGRFHYRVIQAMDSAVVTPILLWLLRWSAAELPPAQRDKALDALESWLVRRAICRLTSKDINRLMLDLLRELHSSGPALAGDVTERFLKSQKADSRFWPSDIQVIDALQDMPIYKSLLRARLRMLLEAIEDRRRTDKSEHSACPRNLTVEHVMPRAWREHWPAVVGVTEAERDVLIHTLGNLTLVNKKLNPALSNRPWTDEEAQARGLGKTGKRSELLKHATLKTNVDLVVGASEVWNDDLIRARTHELAQVVVDIWPAPSSIAAAQVSLAAAEKDALPVVAKPSGPEDTGGRYRPLTDWLRAQTADSLLLRFEEMEDILDLPVPQAAHDPSEWDAPGNPLGGAITAAGFKLSVVEPAAEWVVLIRKQ